MGRTWLARAGERASLLATGVSLYRGEPPGHSQYNLTPSEQQIAALSTRVLGDSDREPDLDGRRPILGEVGRSLGLLPGEGHSLILATAICSITLNPLVFRAVEPIEDWFRRHPRLAAVLDRGAGKLASLPSGAEHPRHRGHAVICGYGDVGRLIGHAFDRRGFSYVVIDQNRRAIEELRARGVPALYGDAASPLVLEHAEVAQARVLLLTITDPPVSRPRHPGGAPPQPAAGYRGADGEPGRARLPARPGSGRRRARRAGGSRRDGALRAASLRRRRRRVAGHRPGPAPARRRGLSGAPRFEP